MSTTIPGRASLHRRLVAPLCAGALALALAACSSGGTTPVKSTPAAPGKRIKGVPVVREPTRSAPRDAAVQMAPGLEGVIGASQSQLTRMFGQPRLDVWEGDARKLQFTGTACVLDVFLYPSTTSKEPHATYVETRRASDGQDVDRAACIAALRGK
ncbi:hypothetical protein [Novosphingobium kaempferiae]|uniref:hypothetical protein n=1 Tax=Novosphingobium kaempferiae TaxID=2896849 RepID=UPI001E31011B|nr:hypothetical protein [Novosphingobium kaempferiae]